MPMPKAAVRITIIVAAVSLIAWIYGYIIGNNGYHWRDFWFFVVLYFIPVVLIAFGSWMAFHPDPWRKLLGVAMLVPSVVIWVLYLMLAASAFRIH